MDQLPKEIEDIIMDYKEGMEYVDNHKEKLDKVCDVINKVVRYEDDYGDNHLYIGWAGFEIENRVVGEMRDRVEKLGRTYEVVVCKKCGGIISTFTRGVADVAWCNCEIVGDGYESMSSDDESIEF